MDKRHCSRYTYLTDSEEFLGEVGDPTAIKPTSLGHLLDGGLGVKPVRVPTVTQTQSCGNKIKNMKNKRYGGYSLGTTIP